MPNLNYDLSSTADQVFAYDYNSSGKQDHLVFYRPGTGIIWIFQNNNGAFTPVYISSGVPRVTISGQVTEAGVGLPGVTVTLSGIFPTRRQPIQMETTLLVYFLATLIQLRRRWPDTRLTPHQLSLAI